MARNPGWPCAVLLVAGVFALVLGGIALYARHAVLDERAFADRATATLQQDEVRDEIAQRIADREIAAIPELAVRRPAVEAAVADVVDGPRFSAEFHAGVTALHESLFAGGAHETALALPGTAKELRAAAAQHSASGRRDAPAGRPTALPHRRRRAREHVALGRARGT